MSWRRYPECGHDGDEIQVKKPTKRARGDFLVALFPEIYYDAVLSGTNTGSGEMIPKDLVSVRPERVRIDNSEEPRVGLWYWVEDPADTLHPRWLGCLVSRVVRLRKGKTVAVFEWEREALDRDGWPLRNGGMVRVRVDVPVAELLHVDAYKPGDWKKFFSDPRTREGYLKWAPTLLAAEECKAGRLRVGDPPPRHVWSEVNGTGL